MSQHTQLQAADGHKFDAYIAQPSGEPKAGVVVLQEIFGVNAHIRSVADRFARAGYLAIAPALFDRAQRDVELAYGPEEGKQGMQIGTAHSARSNPGGYCRCHPVSSRTWRAQSWRRRLLLGRHTRLGQQHASSSRRDSFLLSRRNSKLHPRKIQLPRQFFISASTTITFRRTVVEEVRHEYPGFSVFTYAGAGHAFNRDVGASYNEAAAKLAQQRTLAHFDEFLVAAH